MHYEALMNWAITAQLIRAFVFKIFLKKVFICCGSFNYQFHFFFMFPLSALFKFHLFLAVVMTPSDFSFNFISSVLSDSIPLNQLFWK